MRPVPARQRRQAHRRRKALGRAIHQIRYVRGTWMAHWRAFQRGRGKQPQRLKIPYMLKQHRVRLYRIFTASYAYGTRIAK